VPLPSCKFGEFELDCARYELRRNGQPLKLERIPMELLILLAEKNGDVVSRQQIGDRLWGRDVFIDTEHGINTAIRKIRTALREDAERPRFVQTVQGKGYRLIAELNDGNKEESAPSPEVKTPALPEAILRAAAPAKRGHWGPTAIAPLVLLFVAGVVLVFNLRGLRDRIFAKAEIGPIHTLAVLPLANLSGDPAQDYYADGITDELITALARNRSLRVVSRTSAMQYKGASRPLRKIAQELGVDGILEGSVNRSANHVHINLQLIYAPTDTHIWAESYDRDLKGALSLPQEISQTIAGQAKVASTPSSLQRYVSPEAHDAYLQGRYLWFTASGLESRKYFEKTIQLQPDYAPAWSGLSNTLGETGEESGEPASEIAERVEATARKAVELDDSLPEAHNALAAAYLFYRWDWNRAEAESLRSLEANPNYAEGRHLHSYILFAMNRVEEGLEEQKRATEIDPFERPWALARSYVWTRHYDAAIADLRLRAQERTEYAWLHYILSDAYGFKGMERESARELEEATRLDRGEKAAEELRHAYERGGTKAVAELRLNDLQNRARREYVSAFELALAYAALGNKDKTLDELEGAYRERSSSMVFLQVRPVFDFLHSEPRYRTLVQKMGMPLAY
jgi:TolB-like protein/DNA-binding winged helix-turn-helix (wHTH) protein